MIKRVGVIGLGKMGMPMTRHLLAQGHEVTAFDLQPDAIARAVKLGAKPGQSPRTVAAASELVIVVVGFDNEVMDVVFGPDGVLAGAQRHAVIAVASTVLPETVKKIAAQADELGQGIAVLDIPLCRGEPAAVDGKLLMLAGGDAAVFERCRAVFSAFANDIFLVGALGAGQVGKLVNNLLLWTCICGNYEGLKLAERMGVDAEVLRKALVKSSANNWALETWQQVRPMPWAEKDMAIVMQEADRLRVPLPLAGIVREVIKAIKIEKGDPIPVARK
jgi:3-hydroxyisobutyrate dehydrogenase-like beta-hydroxyacid dehydrogenase